MSPRNSPAAVANMMRKTGCRRLIATRHSLGTLLDGIRTEFASGVDEPIELEIEEPPALAYAYPKLGKETASTPFVPYPKADERPVDDAIMYYLHSSGSTGFPKPIPITYLTAVHWCITRACFGHVSPLRSQNSLVTPPGISVRIRTCRFPHRYPNWCGVAPAIPYPRHVCTAVLSHCFPQERVRVRPDVLS